jgi:hypothetical protein
VISYANIVKNFKVYYNSYSYILIDKADIHMLHMLSFLLRFYIVCLGCKSAPCAYGTCTDVGASDFTCNCAAGFTGRLCDTLAGMLNQHQNRTFNLAPLPPLA